MRQLPGPPRSRAFAEISQTDDKCPQLAGLSFRRSVSATAHFLSQVRLRGICLCTKIPESRDTETGSTETRFDVELTRSESKDSPLARPIYRIWDLGRFAVPDEEVRLR